MNKDELFVLLSLLFIGLVGLLGGYLTAWRLGAGGRSVAVAAVLPVMGFAAAATWFSVWTARCSECLLGDTSRGTELGPTIVELMALLADVMLGIAVGTGMAWILRDRPRVDTMTRASEPRRR